MNDNKKWVDAGPGPHRRLKPPPKERSCERRYGIPKIHGTLVRDRLIIENTRIEAAIKKLLSDPKKLAQNLREAIATVANLERGAANEQRFVTAFRRGHKNALAIVGLYLYVDDNNCLVIRT